MIIANGQRLMMTLKHNPLLPRHAFVALMLVVLSLTGCGQKGALYLVDSDQGVVTSSEVLESGSQPQDAAFSDIGDSEYDRERYLEQEMILPEPSEDPNYY